MLVKNIINSLYNGVNQQPAEMRLETQCEEMINFYPTVNDGMIKRNPISRIELDKEMLFTNDTYDYQYNRGDERYSIHITNGEMEIVNLETGKVYKELYGLNYEGNSRYYLSNGSSGYSCLTIGDTTFIVNRNTIVRMEEPDPFSESEYTFYIWVKDAEPAYGIDYSYKIVSGTIVVEGSGTNGKKTESIASDIQSSINSMGFSQITCTRIGSMIKVTSILPFDTIYFTDSFGDNAIIYWSYDVEDISNLPKEYPFEDGKIFKITGTAGSKTPYYIRFENGTWKETVPLVAKTKLDNYTMPVILTRNSNDTFTLKPYDAWAEKKAGDEETLKNPSFVDKKIKDIFFIRNRLGFITENSVVLSEVGQYGNFFRTTALTLLDSDPIDITVNSTQAVNLEYASNMEDNLLLVSENLQFRQRETDILTPNTISFVPCSAYEINILVRPIFMNNKIYFLAKRGNHSAVIEFYVSTQTGTVTGNDITAHCQSYIPNNIKKLSGSGINNMLFLSNNSDTVWVYKYYDASQQRVQSAWFKWQFRENIQSSFLFGGIFYLIFNSKLAKMDIQPQNYLEKYLDENENPINSFLLIGEWIIDFNGRGKDPSTIVIFRTMEISCEENSEISIFVKDVKRNTQREIPPKFSINNRPLIGGNTRDIKIGLTNNSENGFKINSIVFEGQANTRSRRI
jgi:hypothetical protein